MMRRKILFWLFVIGCVCVLYATDFSLDTYDTATPAGSDDPAEADDRMRETKSSIQVREDVDHYWELTGTEVSDEHTGEHRKILFHEPIPTTPTVAEDHGDLRIKDVNDKAELHWTDEDENELQLTSMGNHLRRGQWLTSSNVAADGSVNLIRADANGVAVVPDNSQTATNAAPTSTTGIVNKKYVDDNVGSANWTPTSYAGEESVTFPNGLIRKSGTGEASPGVQSTKTITFAEAFNTIIYASISLYNSSGTQNTVDSPYLKSWNTSTLTIQRWNGLGHSFNWVAWGY